MSDSSASRVWFITGCSSGFGRALSEKVLARGDRLIATAREPNQLASLVESHRENCRVFALDVTDTAQISSVVAQGAEAFGRLDVVVNNAGYGIVGAFEETSDEQIKRNFDTNFFGALYVMRAVLPILRSQKSGHVVNISAAAAISNYAGFSIYGATKCALEGASESIAAEVKPLGIRVTIVQPGPFRTDFIARSLERSEGRIADYDATSGKFAALLEKMSGRQPGDPARAADAIIAVVDSNSPPLRLVLGKYAHDKVRRRIAWMESELKAWEPVGLPTDFAPGS
jgi:NAD(P)-dependent dehydrogenase (short-subunit alcohol dehydrogenase family)